MSLLNFRCDYQKYFAMSLLNFLSLFANPDKANPDWPLSLFAKPNIAKPVVAKKYIAKPDITMTDC